VTTQSEGDGGTTVAALGEDGLVRGVIARYAPPPAGVLVGPGDDAAVLDLPGRSVISTDTLVEGYDFLRTWSSAHDVGVKTAAQNLADVAAMGATPFALVVSLATPGDLPAVWARDLADGLADECARAGAAVVGGDVSQAGEIVVTGTAVGLLPGPAVLRSGARAGDVVALAGVTGPSAAGLALLRAGHSAGESAAGESAAGESAAGESATHDGHAGLVRAHLAPRPDYPAGVVAAAAGATAMIDISDGLLRDARRVAEASGVVLDLDPAALAPAADLLAAASTLGDEGLAFGWVLSGGEDHALLACFPAGVAVPAPFRPIGEVRAQGEAGPMGAIGAAGVLVGGRPHDGVEGWRHFT
jgi:thiamine-monophosphate kinase